MSKEISQEVIGGFKQTFSGDMHARAMQNALSKHNIHDLSFSTADSAFIRNKFSCEIPTLKVTNQKASGRCWIFAGLNVLRELIAKKYNLDDFEFSQNYIAFYDKLEKANYMLESIIETAARDYDDRTVAHILATGIQDGGQWDMFTAIVEKYGLVPKDAMPETFQSENTGAMNRILNARLREAAVELRGICASSGNDKARECKLEVMAEIYKILCMCFGTPPCCFDFEYVDKDKKYGVVKSLTPIQFFKEYTDINLNDYVSIVNAPTEDKPFNRTYTVDFLGGVYEGAPILYLNVPIETLKALVIKQLKAGEVVWFGSDVGHFGERAAGVWDDNSYDYELTLGLKLHMTKAERLCYRHSAMNHAMVITGVNLDGDTPNRYKIQNSWGDKNGKDGYFIMSDTWFDDFVYQAVIHKNHLSDEQKNALKQDPIHLNPWDPMGSLA